MTQTPVILSLDVGSSSVRLIGFDTAGREQPELAVRESLSMETTLEGGAYFDPGEVIAAVIRCLDRIHALMQDTGRYSPLGISACTFASSLCGLSPSGSPRTELVTYADTRSVFEAKKLQSLIDPQAVHQRTGAYLHTSYWLAQLAWLKEQRPDLFSPGADTRWMTVGELILKKLTGTTGISHSEASWTGLYNRFNHAWDVDLIEGIGIDPGSLPRIVPDLMPTPKMSDAFAHRWPLFHGIPFFQAIGDGAAANLGVDPQLDGRVVISVGTTSAVRVAHRGVSDDVPRGGWSYQVSEEISLVGGALTEGGNLFAWIRDLVRARDLGEFETELKTRQPAQHGLVFLPLLSGERSPGWRADMRGAFTGISLTTSPLDLVQAAYEAVAYRLASVYLFLQPWIKDGAEVVACGGAANASPAFIQILADAIGQPVLPSAEHEASARGAAVLALKNLGLYRHTSEQWATSYNPNPGNHSLHCEGMRRQNALYRVLAYFDPDKPETAV